MWMTHKDSHVYRTCSLCTDSVYILRNKAKINVYLFSVTAKHLHR